MNDLTLKQAPVLLWLLNFGIIREGFNKKKKKSLEFSTPSGGTPPLQKYGINIFFYFIYGF